MRCRAELRPHEASPDGDAPRGAYRPRLGLLRPCCRPLLCATKRARSVVSSLRRGRPTARAPHRPHQLANVCATAPGSCGPSRPRRAARLGLHVFGHTWVLFAKGASCPFARSPCSRPTFPLRWASQPGTTCSSVLWTGPPSRPAHLYRIGRQLVCDAGQWYVHPGARMVGENRALDLLRVTDGWRALPYHPAAAKRSAAPDVPPVEGARLPPA